MVYPTVNIKFRGKLAILAAMRGWEGEWFFFIVYINIPSTYQFLCSNSIGYLENLSKRGYLSTIICPLSGVDL